MILRVFFSLLIVLTLVSCDFSAKRIGFSFMKTEIDTLINYTKVDELPVFPECKNLIDTDKKNRCFINHLYNHFADSLLKHTFGVSGYVDETVIVRIKIDARGNASLDGIQSSDLIKRDIPKLDSIINESIATLPIFFPAIKTAIPVSTVFELPIVVKLK